VATSQQQLAFAVRAVNEASAVLKQVQADIDGVGDKAEQSTKKTGGLGSSLGSVGKIAGGFVIGAALTQLPGLLTGAAQAAADDEAATMRLEQSLKNYAATIDDDVLGVTRELMGDVEERIKAGQKLAFTDDEVRDSLQALLAATGDYGEATKRQAAAFDLARGAGIPLATATKMLGKLNEENIEVFKKLGIVLGENATEADALAAVQAKFGGQSKVFAESTAGQFEVAKIQMGELKEQMGSALLPVLTKLAPVAIKFFEAVAKVPAPVLAVGVAIAGVLAVVAPLIPAITAVGAVVGAVAAGPLLAVVAAFAAVIAIGVLVYRNWDTIKDRAGDMAEWVMTAFGRVKDFVAGIFANDMLQAIAKVAFLFTPLGPLAVIWKFKDEIASALSGLFDVFAKAFGPVIGLLEKVGGWLFDIIGKVKNLGMTEQPRSFDTPTFKASGNPDMFGEGEGFDSGGVIPGPRGMPVLVKAHAGETILPTHKGGAFGNTYNVTVQGLIVGTEMELARVLRQVLNNDSQRGTLGFA